MANSDLEQVLELYEELFAAFAARLAVWLDSTCGCYAAAVALPWWRSWLTPIGGHGVESVLSALDTHFRQASCGMAQMLTLGQLREHCIEHARQP